MKKFLTILALAGVMTACNDADDETTDGDSLTTGDSLNMNPPPPMPSSDSLTNDSLTRSGSDTMLKK